MTGRIEIADLPEAWQIAVAIEWLTVVPEDTAARVPSDELAAHFNAYLTDQGDYMLSQEIACVRSALEAALQHDNPELGRVMIAGAAARLEQLEAEAFNWEQHAVIVPEQRFGPGSQAGSNVVPLRPRPEGGAP